MPIGPDLIDRLAVISVARGCGFGGLAIATTMVGASSNIVWSLQFGGLGFLLMAVILFLRGARSEHFPFKRSEVWIMLEKTERPPEAVAARMIARARREAHLRFAYAAALIAAAMLGFAVILRLIGG